MLRYKLDGLFINYEYSGEKYTGATYENFGKHVWFKCNARKLLQYYISRIENGLDPSKYELPRASSAMTYEGPCRVIKDDEYVLFIPEKFFISIKIV